MDNTKYKDITPKMSDYTNGTIIISASSEYSSSSLAWKAFDDFHGKHGSSEGESLWMSKTTPAWLQIDYGEIKSVNGYSIQSRWRDDGFQGFPTTFTFEGSNDGSTWTILDTQTNLTWVNNEKKIFLLNDTVKYRIYKINITKTTNSSSAKETNISEFEIFNLKKEIFLLANKDKIISIDNNDNIIELQKINDESFIKYGMYDSIQFEKIFSNKKYISKHLEENTRKININKKPLRIAFK